MKIFPIIFLSCIGLISYGQEKPSLTIDWETWNTHIADNSSQYTLEHKEITPSLSYIRELISTGNYVLMEINLSIDLRKQHLENETPILLLPENKFIQSDYAFSLPNSTNQNQNNLRFTITGNGGYNTNNTGKGSVKNNAYRDASTYTGIYCPVTGVPLTY
ncbi:hypothetical protein D1815_04180 [Aquimarina sp. AD1]|uniref:hypothetical protein n=1 Tax=unclassified Aquimarina TaxID=2627091 RepID=UPI000D558A7D|nr:MULTISPECIES: hypothetical protein [unclassified Aquimarina]AXT54991.1 hypothetical protein D1815_04180 [Aquimarina sp. AD1]RKN18429.1 hypothetical protein D7035_14335 [Aquimarina sp. AD1]